MAFKIISDCPKGKWPFRWHRWAYDYDIKVIDTEHWPHSLFWSMNGRNMIEVNKRYVCDRCGKIEMI